MDVVDVDNPQSWVGHTFTGIKGLFKGQQFVCEGLDGDKAVFHLKTADDDLNFPSRRCGICSQEDGYVSRMRI